jgi:hypothetical protein
MAAQPIAFATGPGGTTYAYVLPASLVPGAQPLTTTTTTATTAGSGGGGGGGSTSATQSAILQPLPTTDPNVTAQIQYIAYDPNQPYAAYAYFAPQLIAATPTGTVSSTPTVTTPTTTTAGTVATPSLPTTTAPTTSTTSSQSNFATNRYTPY